MKLAEALVVRADLQKKIDELEGRLVSNAVVQDGEEPAENPSALLRQLNSSLKQLEDLVTQINLTNAGIEDDEGNTMTNLLAKRDVMKKHQRIMRYFLDSASISTHRNRPTEIAFKSTIAVSRIQKDLDKEAANLRKLELKIQEMNWTNELIQ